MRNLLRNFLAVTLIAAGLLMAEPQFAQHIGPEIQHFLLTAVDFLCHAVGSCAQSSGIQQFLHTAVNFVCDAVGSCAQCLASPMPGASAILKMMLGLVLVLTGISITSSRD